MDIGIFIFATDYSIPIDDLAREAEARGFESLWVPEHTHIPTSRRSPWPGGPDLPHEYKCTFDPFVSLTAAAAATTRLKIGTGICLVIERDTIITAKEVASLDVLSRGRLLFGIGAGWNAEEMENHGTDFDTRFKRMREQVLAMQAIWTTDEAEYHGRFVDFDPIWCWPKPVQKPHPPVILGGSGPHTLRRVVEFCDGWIPLGRDAGVLDEVQSLRRLAREKGRDPDTISITMFGATPDREALDRLAAAGFQRAVLRLPSEGRDSVLPLLDRYRELIGQEASV